MANKEFKDIAELEAFIDAISTKFTKNHLKAHLELAGNMVRNVIEESFGNETDPVTGQRWKPISSVSAMASYNKGKLKDMKKNAHIKSGKRLKSSFVNKFGAGGSKKILQESGALASDWHLRFTDMAVEVYNDTTSNGFPYGMSHVTGSDNLFGRGIKMPSRNFLPIDIKTGDLMDKLQDEVTNVMLEYIEKEVLK